MTDTVGRTNIVGNKRPILGVWVARSTPKIRRNARRRILKTILCLNCPLKRLRFHGQTVVNKLKQIHFHAFSVVDTFVRFVFRKLCNDLTFIKIKFRFVQRNFSDKYHFFNSVAYLQNCQSLFVTTINGIFHLVQSLKRFADKHNFSRKFFFIRKFVFVLSFKIKRKSFFAQRNDRQRSQSVGQSINKIIFNFHFLRLLYFPFLFSQLYFLL